MRVAVATRARILSSTAAAAMLLASFAAPAQAYVLAGPGAALTVHSGDWAWEGGQHLQAYRDAVTDPARFGIGTVPIEITLLDLDAIDAAALAPADGFIAPFWNEVDVPSAARAAIVDFFLGGGDLVLIQDSYRYDAIGAALGLASAGTSDDVLWNGSGPMFNGPFGATSNIVQLGLAGRLAPADVVLTNGTVAATNSLGQVTAAYWAEGQYLPGAGNLVVIADVDTLSTWQNSANYVLMDNEARFALNTTAFIVIECGDGAVDASEGCDDGDLDDGDGCDSNCRPTGCGNGVLTSGEQCDDGDLTGGDGCSGACLCEAAGDGDGDGIPDACDNCPSLSNASQADADVDGAGDVCDACPSDPADDADDDTICGDTDFCPFDPADDIDLDGLCANVDACTNPDGERDILSPAKLAFRFVNTDLTPNNDTLNFSAEFLLPLGMSFGDIDPTSVPIRFRMEFVDGTSPVDVLFPMASYAGGGTAGWILNGAATRWRFSDTTGAPDNGLVKVMVQSVGAAAEGRVRVKVHGKEGSYTVSPGDLPLRGIITIGEAAFGECAEANFVTANCRTMALGNTITCRR